MYIAIKVPLPVFSAVNDYTVVTFQVTTFMFLLYMKSHSSKLKYGNLIHLLFTLQPRENFITFPIPFTTTLAIVEYYRSND